MADTEASSALTGFIQVSVVKQSNDQTYLGPIHEVFMWIVQW